MDMADDDFRLPGEPTHPGESDLGAGNDDEATTRSTTGAAEPAADKAEAAPVERPSEPLTDPLPDPLDRSRPFADNEPEPRESRSLKEAWPIAGAPAPAAPEAPVTEASDTDAPASALPSAQHFQDLIALRREAEESAAAALHERREATSQASRIIEEAMRASETLQSEARQDLERRRATAEAEAAAILERARAEAAEIVRAGENDVREAQRLRLEASAERERINTELERIRRTAQEELFAEANRHAARMDEIRTRVLHGVEAITGGLREPARDALPAMSPAPEPRAADVRPPDSQSGSQSASRPYSQADGPSRDDAQPEPAAAAPTPATFTVSAPPAPEPVAEPDPAPAAFWGTPEPAGTTPAVTPPPGIPADAPITPYTPAATDSSATRETVDERVDRGKRGWRSRRS